MLGFKNLKNYFLILLFISTSLLVVNAESIQQKKVLKIGTTPNYPPIMFKKKGKYVGIEADLANLLKTELGYEIEYLDVPMDSIIDYLKNGKIDLIMSGLSVTYERQLDVQFLFPFMSISQMAITRKELEDNFESADDIYNTTLKVGFEKSTTGELLVKENIKGAKPFSFKSPEEGIKALRDKKIDVFIYDSPLIWKITSESENVDISGLFWPLTEEDIAWAVHKDNASLNHSLNMAILKWKRNGTLTKVLNKWIKVRRTFLPWEE